MVELNAARVAAHLRRIHDVGGKGVTIERDWSAAPSTSDGSLVLLAPPLPDAPVLPRPIAPDDLDFVKKSLREFEDDDPRAWLDIRDNGDRELVIGVEGVATAHCPLDAPYGKQTGWLPQAGVEQLRRAVSDPGLPLDSDAMKYFSKRWNIAGSEEAYVYLPLEAEADAADTIGLASPARGGIYNELLGYHLFGTRVPHDAPTALHFPPKHFARLVKLRRGAEVEVLPERRLLVLRRDGYLYVLRGHRWGEEAGEVWPLQRPV